ncbi:MAG TPA: HNH endonuclease signature motif containing protein [Terriglobales bacterium]|nr:HNH endonuclease signature motif containing protein [Terriglobales bacterium]
MSLLKEAANPGWPRVSKRLWTSIRDKYSARSWALLNVTIEVCGCCQEQAPEEKHHVIPAAYGGPSEDLNLIKICLLCHAEIHPWMKTGQSRELAELPSALEPAVSL